jgi:hypothetical protein
MARHGYSTKQLAELFLPLGTHTALPLDDVEEVLVVDLGIHPSKKDLQQVLKDFNDGGKVDVKAWLTSMELWPPPEAPTPEARKRAHWTRQAKPQPSEQDKR